MTRLQTALLTWYRRHGRDLPWRHTRDPYRILVSEVMLQQTQVDRVLGYYQTWLEAFPDPEALAASSVERLHRLWKGLGYPSRADRLHACCRTLLGEHGGVWPERVEELLRLPGIGPYTAGAVACFAFGQAVAVVDTNVARVYARRDGLGLPLDRREIWRHAATLVSAEDPIAYTNALMDLGATVCTARVPRCPDCPWRSRCASAGEGGRHRATANPMRAESRREDYCCALRPDLVVVLALIHHDGRYLAALRGPGSPFAGYWELPGGKREAGEDDRRALARELDEELGCELLSARPFLVWDHDQDGKRLRLRCYRCRLFTPEQARPLVAARIGWFTPREVMHLDFIPANAPLLRRFARYHRLSG